MAKKDAVVLAVMVIGAVALVCGVNLGAQRPWRSECYGTLDAMVKAMNQHPDAQMQLMAVPSSRNALGWLGDPYCVVWR